MHSIRQMHNQFQVKDIHTAQPTTANTETTNKTKHYIYYSFVLDSVTFQHTKAFNNLKLDL